MQFTVSHDENISVFDSSSVKKVNEVCISSNVGAGFENESGELNKNYVQQEILISPACARYRDGNLRLKTRPLIEYTRSVRKVSGLPLYLRAGVILYHRAGGTFQRNPHLIE